MWKTPMGKLQENIIYIYSLHMVDFPPSDDIFDGDVRGIFEYHWDILYLSLLNYHLVI